MSFEPANYDSLDKLLDELEKVNFGDFEVNKIRDLREGLHEIESALSFYRRLVQGWLDIAMAQASTSKPENTEDTVIDKLPKILNSGPAAETVPHPWAAPTQGYSFSPNVEDLIKRTLGETWQALTRITADPNEVVRHIKELERVEKTLSGLRRRCHKIIGDLQAVLVEKYKVNLDALNEVIN